MHPNEKIAILEQVLQEVVECIDNPTDILSSNKQRWLKILSRMHEV